MNCITATVARTARYGKLSAAKEGRRSNPYGSLPREICMSKWDGWKRSATGPHSQKPESFADRDPPFPACLVRPHSRAPSCSRDNPAIPCLLRPWTRPAIQEHDPVAVVLKNWLLAVTPAHHVITCPLRIESSAVLPRNYFFFIAFVSKLCSGPCPPQLALALLFSTPGHLTEA